MIETILTTVLWFAVQNSSPVLHQTGLVNNHPKFTVWNVFLRVTYSVSGGLKEHFKSQPHSMIIQDVFLIPTICVVLSTEGVIVNKKYTSHDLMKLIFIPTCNHDGVAVID